MLPAARNREQAIDIDVRRCTLGMRRLGALDFSSSENPACARQLYFLIAINSGPSFRFMTFALANEARAAARHTDQLRSPDAITDGEHLVIDNCNLAIIDKNNRAEV